MKVPNRSDWGSIDKHDLDGNCAFKQFFGKSFSEAESMFQENAMYYQEDLQSMPSVPFNFYAPALAKYIISDRARDDCDGASTFLHMVKWMLQTQHDMITKKTEQLLVEASDHVARNQLFYDADIDIYGSFSEIYSEIRQYV